MVAVAAVADYIVRSPAALKCRQRKKAWLAQLQAKVEFLQNENERLSQALMSAREEITRLSSLVGTSAAAGAVTVVSNVNPLPNGSSVQLSSTAPAPAHQQHAQAAAHAHNSPHHQHHPHQHQRPSESPTGSIAPVSVNVSLPGGGKSLPAPAPQAGMVGGRGYGY